MSDKMLNRIAGLVAHAESLPVGSPERESYMEKAIDLAAVTKIDLALARAHQRNKTKRETPEKKSFRVGTYVGSRISNNAKWMVELFTDIAAVYDIECTIGGSNVYVHCYGFPSDIAVAEKLFTMISTEMVAEADAIIRAGKHKEVRTVRRTKRVENPDYVPEHERYVLWGSERNDPQFTRKTIEVYDNDEDGNPVYVEKPVSVDGRVWRANFYDGFKARVISRLWEAKRKAEKDAGITKENRESNETAIVLRDKKQEAKEFYAEQVKHLKLGTWSPPEPTQFVVGGQTKGMDAGAKVDLSLTEKMDKTDRREIG